MLQSTHTLWYRSVGARCFLCACAGRCGMVNKSNTQIWWWPCNPTGLQLALPQAKVKAIGPLARKGLENTVHHSMAELVLATAATRRMKV
jgi:hypothetical protein